MAFAVCVTFEIEPAEMAKFSALMSANAKTSFEKEPGCLQFDVCTDESRPNEVFLYELYKSADAFDLHLRSDHFREFDSATALMIIDKEVRTYRTVG